MVHVRRKTKMSTGDRIRTLREQRGITQEDLASVVGYKTRSSIAKIENGDSDPSQRMLLKIANALDVSPAELLEEPTGQETPVPPPRTTEARILAAGIDQLPPDDRKKALDMMKLMFSKYAHVFERNDDDEAGL